MIQLPNIRPGEPIPPDLFAKLVRALRELQALAIVHVQAPLQREGATLSSRLAAGLPPVPDPDAVEMPEPPAGEEERLDPTRYGDWEKKGIAVDF